ncbi:TonB-dependent siderophore receptor [Algihabitans sp.]|uniref:TonB-dependent siderophore receptor n=1 Tax=Algihabitans sp. TaxID=2821514 RepID=UPI003BA9D9CC
MSLSFALRHLRYLRQSGVVGRCAFTVAAATCLGLLFPAQGVTASGTAPTQRVQATGEVQAFDIPAGPLAASLNALSRAAGLTLAVDPAEVAGKTAPAVSGTFTPQQALERLLAGSGLRHRFTNSATVTLEPVVARVGEDGLLELDPIRVEGEGVDFGPSQIGNLPPAFAGGQVGEGARLGVLGNRSVFDTPFNQTSYTEEFIQARQARRISEVLVADPSIRSASPRTDFGALYISRGFALRDSDFALNGLYGLLPSGSRKDSVSAFERIEFLKGPNAFAYGISPSGRVGGTVNLVPKRAEREPVTELTGSYFSELQFGSHLDVGRRFGRDQMFGVRTNLELRDGTTTATDGADSKEFLGFGSVALDWQGEQTRATLDLMYERSDLEAPATAGFILAPGVQVPDAPNGRINHSQRWHSFENETFSAIASAEHDILPNALTATAQFGYAYTDFTRFLFLLPTILDDIGTLSGSATTFNRFRSDAFSGEAGLRANFDIGPVNHQVALVGSALYQDNQLAAIDVATPYAASLYDPVSIPDPGRPDAPSNLQGGNQQDLFGTTLSNTLSILDDRVQLTLGARFQSIETKNFDVATGEVTGEFDDNAVSPAAALLIKPIEELSLYANYVEGLSPGPVAPANAVNFGEAFAPIVTEQVEVGAKWDLDTFGVTLSAFRITQPQGLLDPATNRFGVDAEQRNQGVELNLFGEPIDGFRMLGGVAYLDAELTETAGGTNDGNSVPGVSNWAVNLGAEVDIPWIEGVTLSGLGVYTGSAEVDAANTATIPSWWRLDLGAAYDFSLYDTEWELRAAVNNVTDEAYFLGTSFSGFLTVGEPRTFLLSLKRVF